ncbi:MAG: MBL fold metallo-hydrolase [Ignavibacterium sp.]|jgi:L-ascorbate metabolism protein UlaG (beta-lactamase superfamily)|nr:MBL fold metallo-hydrolase [Ignavibacterium sp.]
MNRRRFIRNISLISAGFLFITEKIQGKEPPVFSEYKPDPSLWKEDEINIAWIGHSTVLINFFGTTILTDPVFYERIGVSIFGMTFGPSRFTYPALTIDEIPKPDIILLSHAHMDHMDYESLDTITKTFPDQIDCITAYNTADVVAELKWKSLQEIDWGEETELLRIKFKANEVKHFGWRYPWEKDRSNGYMQDGRSYNAVIIEKDGKKILFGGDTAYHELFKPLKNENIDIAIMPIGAYNPWKKNHCNPEEALIMAEEHIGAKYFIPIHTKTFKQGMEPIEEPLAWLNESVSKYKINLALDDIGKTFTLSNL